MPLPRQIRRSVGRQAERLLETGQRFERFNSIRQRHFWSTHTFKPNENGYIDSGTFQLFTTPPGQSGQGMVTPLSELETNWKASTRVPDNQNLEITEFGVSMWHTPYLPNDVQEPNGVGVKSQNPDRWSLNPFDAASFLQNTVLAITYLTNQVELGMISDFAQASAPYVGSYQPSAFINNYTSEGSVTGAPAGQSAFSSNGMPAPGLRRRFKIPILLQHGETFSFTMIIPRSFAFAPFAMGPDGTVQPENLRFIQARLDMWATESFVEKS